VEALDLRDSHLHLADLCDHEALHPLDSQLSRSWQGIVSCHRLEEHQKNLWILQNSLKSEQDHTREAWFFSLGIHPQDPDPQACKKLSVYYEKLGPKEKDQIRALGECGYDFFDLDRSNTEKGEVLQDQVFAQQLDYALSWNLPLLIHCRKAMDKFFVHAKTLRKVPAVIFHAWPSNSREALQILDKGIPAYFSLGTPLLRGSKKALDTLTTLPKERILMETDAPFQTLKESAFTPRETLYEVYAFSASKLDMPLKAWAEIQKINFNKAFFVRNNAGGA